MKKLKNWIHRWQKATEEYKRLAKLQKEFAIWLKEDLKTKKQLLEQLRCIQEAFEWGKV